MSAARLDELAANLQAARDRVAAACAAARRDPADVTLVAVSKTWPASDVLLLASLGVADFGESYDREAAAKAAALSAAQVAVRWHFIGGLQRNKCRSIASYADVVHSVDRAEVAAALGSGAVRAGRELAALVQVAFDAAAGPGRAGCPPADAPGLAAAVATTRGLRLRGVMTIAPLGAPPGPVFDRLRALAEELHTTYRDATVISAGMTGDLEEAVAAGATHVRVGTALFGARAPRG